MKFLNSLWINTKKLIFSGKFIFSAIIFAAFCFASKYINGEASPPTTIEFIFRFISNPEEYSHISAQDMFGYFDNSYWFSIIFPVLVSFAEITDFHDEWFSSAYYSSISRQGNLRFALSKTFSYAISGVLLTAFGIIVYGAVIFAVFPFSGDEIYVNFATEAVLKVLNLLALGAIYPLISVIIMMFLRDGFLSEHSAGDKLSCGKAGRNFRKNRLFRR